MSTFQAAIPGTIFNETGIAGGGDGAYTNKATDAGGPTKWGISQLGTKLNTGTAWTIEQIQSMTLEQAKAYYLRYYWPQLYGLIQCQDVASKLFDTGVNDGPGTAVMICQRALRDCGKTIVVDCLFGPQTLAQINMVDGNTLLNAMCDEQIAEYKAIVAKHPEESVNLSEWLVRAEYLRPKQPTQGA
jgi:lysozyme family protein